MDHAPHRREPSHLVLCARWQRQGERRAVHLPAQPAVDVRNSSSDRNSSAVYTPEIRPLPERPYELWGAKRIARELGIARNTVKRLRKLRLAAEHEGMQALFTRASGGKESTIGPRLRVRLERMFDDGITPTEAHRRIEKRHKLGHTTVWRAHEAWKAKRAAVGGGRGHGGAGCRQRQCRPAHDRRRGDGPG
jgi:hypothetical protein